MEPIELKRNIAWKIVPENETTDVILYARTNNSSKVIEVKVDKLNVNVGKLQHISTHKQLEKALFKASILISGYKYYVDDDSNVIFYGGGIELWKNPNAKPIVRRNSKYRKVEDIANG